jgi:glutamate dehydrogenase/leucine dehydrogenase
VIVSYFEQVQNNTNYYWNAEEVDTKLKQKITQAASDVYKISKEYQTSLRSASYIIALKKIFVSMKERGAK